MAILVPVADGPIREEILDVAVELATGLDQELYVVHLVAGDTAGPGDKQIRDELRERLADVDVPAQVTLERVGHWGPRAGTRLGQDVLELAADVDVTHIVMGHTSKGILEGLVRGSTVEAVIDGSPVPVTVVSERVARS